jgi:hypothetical protein
MPDNGINFAEDDVNDLLELLLTLPDDSIFPFQDNSLMTTPNFEIPADVAVDVAVGSLSTHPPG